MRELSFRDAVPVHDDPVRLVAARALVEHHQVLFDLIRFQICNFSSALQSFKEGIYIFSKWLSPSLTNLGWSPVCAVERVQLQHTFANQIAKQLARKCVKTGKKTKENATHLLGWASWLPTTAAMLGFLLSPTGGWVTSAPRKITFGWNSHNAAYRRHGRNCRTFGNLSLCVCTPGVCYSRARWKLLVGWKEPELSSLLPVSH